MKTSRMRKHAAFGPTDLSFCTSGGVADVVNTLQFFLKIGSGVPELEDLKNGISH